jgi:SAM-dependent methyltransferase
MTPAHKRDPQVKERIFPDDLIQFLACPDDRSSVVQSDTGLRSSNGREFRISAGVAIMYPRRAEGHAPDLDAGWKESDFKDSFRQYVALSRIKASAHPDNLAPDDVWHQRHMARSGTLLSSASGTLLDIGCGDADNVLPLLPTNIRYVGVDPTFEPDRPSYICGLAEKLPFKSGVFDCVSFLTSLDHILDYHTALHEAKRVLKPGGKLFLATLIWHSAAELFNDHIHFHHFRESQIKAAMQDIGLTLKSSDVYDWKNSANRSAWYSAWSAM